MYCADQASAPYTRVTKVALRQIAPYWRGEENCAFAAVFLVKRDHPQPPSQERPSSTAISRETTILVGKIVTNVLGVLIHLLVISRSSLFIFHSSFTLVTDTVGKIVDVFGALVPLIHFSSSLVHLSLFISSLSLTHPLLISLPLLLISHSSLFIFCLSLSC